jgi:hypothetical protein
VRPAQRPVGPAWVAGSVRARHLLARRLGRRRARALATSPSLDDGLAVLEGTAYGRRVHAGMSLAEAQRAIVATALWHMRILAGWLPPGGVRTVRALAGWFELANIEDRLRYIAGEDVPAPFELGGLATAWPLLAGAQSPREVRAGLVGSAWGDPGTGDPGEMGLALRLSWARRVSQAVPEAGGWASGAVALVLAREMFAADRPPGALAALRPPGVGSAWPRASSPPALEALLPREAARALEGIEDADGLWRAEVAWWRGVEEDAGRLAGGGHMGRPTVVGCVALLGVDARRTAGALEAAARAGAPAALAVVDEIG